MWRVSDVNSPLDNVLYCACEYCVILTPIVCAWCDMSGVICV